MERINPMYGIMPVVVSDILRAYRPTIESAIELIEDMDKAFKDYSRNKWVQEIKANYRRNKRKRMRCKRRVR